MPSSSCQQAEFLRSRPTGPKYNAGYSPCFWGHSLLPVSPSPGAAAQDGVLGSRSFLTGTLEESSRLPRNDRVGEGFQF